jgi:hypothetical protein
VAAVESQLLEALESIRGLSPTPLRVTGRIAAQARDAYVRSGLARRVEHMAAITTWYVGRLRRRRR